MRKPGQLLTNEEKKLVEERALKSWSKNLSRGDHIEYETHLWASSLGYIEQKQKEIFAYLRETGRLPDG